MSKNKTLMEKEKEYSKAVKIVSVIKYILSEVKKYMTDIILYNVPEEEQNNYFIKTEMINNNIDYKVSVFNSQTNACAYKVMPLMEFLYICSTLTMQEQINYMVITLVNKTQCKKYDEYTEVLI